MSQQERIIPPLLALIASFGELVGKVGFPLDGREVGGWRPVPVRSAGSLLAMRGVDPIARRGLREGGLAISGWLEDLVMGLWHWLSPAAESGLFVYIYTMSGDIVVANACVVEQ